MANVVTVEGKMAKEVINKFLLHSPINDACKIYTMYGCFVQRNTP
jgi:hypothetical protein